MADRETRLLAAAQAFIAVTRGGILEHNQFWTDLRDAVAAYPLQVVAEPTFTTSSPMVAQHTYTPRCDGFHAPGACPNG